MNAEIPENWEAEAEAFVRHFASTEGATVEQRQLNEILVAFRMRPLASGAAPMSLIVSPYEVIVEAGRATRFELDPLPLSGDEVKDILDAVAAGRLNERAGWFGVKFKLDLRSGRTLSGRVVGRGVQRGTVRYQPYQSQAGDASEPSES